MQHSIIVRSISLILACILSLSFLPGCSKKTEGSSDSSGASVTSSQKANDTSDALSSFPELVPPSDTANNKPASSETSETDVGPEAKARAEEEARRQADEEARKQAEEEARKKAEEEARLKAEEEARNRAKQLNSYSMMYYLAITAEEIRASKDNRLVLDDIYTSLLNDINPGAIDEITQDHLQNLRDIIKDYLLISTKRDRLQFMYNQEKATAIRNAVPNPVAILSLTNAMDWKKLAISVAYAAIDSYSRYKNASKNADNNFLMSGWELDDEEVKTVQKNRDRAFNYMTDMVQEYGLDGLLTLNEEAITTFTEICAIESIPEKINRLVSEENTYKLLGNYWLELADCYFETNKYAKCLECIARYNDLTTKIFRTDFNYANILPKAIVAAQKTYSDNEYISTVQAFTDDLVKNTPKKDWAPRYFAAQVYLDLYARTQNTSYLKTAYTIANENVTILLKYQRSLNKTYLKDVEDIPVEEPDYRFLTEKEKKEKEQWYKEEKKRVSAYNKELKETRKTELPSLYEPLVLNCELLFALAEKIDISEEEKEEIEAVLQTTTNGTFLTKPINDSYSFSQRDRSYTADLTKDELTMSADLLTANSVITITVTENGNSETFNDCEITKVEREEKTIGTFVSDITGKITKKEDHKEQTIDTFIAHISSKQFKKHAWTAGSKVTVTITYTDAYERTIAFNFKISEFQEHVYGDTVVFEQE